MINDINGAIFDLDGTLVDSLFLWDVIWEEFGIRFLDGDKFLIEETDDKKVRTMTLKNAMDFLHTKYNLASSGEELLAVTNEIIADFYSNKVELKKGVLELLEYCYQKNIKMCIASATDMELINLAIDHCNIRKYFVDILSCTQIGKGKDEPDIYLKALDCLGTEKEKTCVFEDSHIAIRTALKLGLKTVGIYDKFNYGYDEIKKIATVCVDEGETLEKLISK